MPLELRVESLENVPETLHSFYKKNDDGIFELDADYSGFHETIRKVRGERDTWKKKASRLESSIKDQEEEENLNNLDVDGYRKLLKKERIKHKKELTEKEKEKNSYIIDREIRDAALSSGVIPELVGDVATITGRNFSVRDGQIEVLDDEGEPLGITPGEYFGSVFKEQRPHYYKSSGKSGSGALGHIGSNLSKHATSLNALRDEGAKEGGVNGARKMLTADIVSQMRAKK